MTAGKLQACINVCMCKVQAMTMICDRNGPGTVNEKEDSVIHRINRYLEISTKENSG